MFEWLFPKRKKYSNITIIPTVATTDGIWSSDVRKLPKEIPGNQKVVYVRTGTKVGEWTCPTSGFYPWPLIVKYRKDEK